MAAKPSAECERCVIADEGNLVLVDVDHADYPRPGLGDRLAAGLAAVGVTEERVARVTGRPCSCRKRREALNELGRAAGLP